MYVQISHPDVLSRRHIRPDSPISAYTRSRIPACFEFVDTLKDDTKIRRPLLTRDWS